MDLKWQDHACPLIVPADNWRSYRSPFQATCLHPKMRSTGRILSLFTVLHLGRCPAILSWWGEGRSTKYIPKLPEAIFALHHQRRLLTKTWHHPCNHAWCGYICWLEQKFLAEWYWQVSNAWKFQILQSYSKVVLWHRYMVMAVKYYCPNKQVVFVCVGYCPHNLTVVCPQAMVEPYYRW